MGLLGDDNQRAPATTVFQARASAAGERDPQRFLRVRKLEAATPTTRAPVRRGASEAVPCQMRAQPTVRETFGLVGDVRCEVCKTVTLAAPVLMLQNVRYTRP
jgi:hypothetical protein